VLVWKEIQYGKMTPKEKEAVVNEINILSQLNHPTIVKYHGR
jgi:NIMA (never in mitosis gene a)-related kinase